MKVINNCFLGTPRYWIWQATEKPKFAWWPTKRSYIAFLLAGTAIRREPYARCVRRLYRSKACHLTILGRPGSLQSSNRKKQPRIIWQLANRTVDLFAVIAHSLSSLCQFSYWSFGWYYYCVLHLADKCHWSEPGRRMEKVRSKVSRAQIGRYKSV